MKEKRINAVMVHHNAPGFCELAVRSLLASHTLPLNVSLTVYDNASQLDFFERLLKFFGLGQLMYYHAHDEVCWDSCELMTKVMRTHGFDYLVSEITIGHLSSVSYSKTQRERHLPRCCELLEQFRFGDLS